MVVDDHPIVRQGLVAVLEDEADLEVVGAVGSAREALRTGRSDSSRTWCCSTWRCRSWTASRRFRCCSRRAPGWRCSCLRRTTPTSGCSGAVRAGARGYLLKGASADGDRARHPHWCMPAARTWSRAWPRRLMAEVASPRRESLASERTRARSAAPGRRGPANQTDRAQLSITERTVKFHVQLDFPQARRRQPRPGGGARRATRPALDTDCRR